jgi:PPM family protein phosphatase
MKTFSITDVGMKRKVNQDYIFCEENVVGSFPNLFIVADGMGGHKAGDYASRFCVSAVVDSIKNSKVGTIIGAFEQAINNANKALLEESEKDEELKGMGTTFVAATIIGFNMYVANIGDSRLYVISDEMTQITEDHSLVQAMVKTGEIDKIDARSHPNKNVITRALGSNQSVIADYFEVELKKGETVLICSDGLTNMMDDEEIFNIIQHNPDDLNLAGHQLVEKANNQGGKDNIAIIIIRM